MAGAFVRAERAEGYQNSTLDNLPPFDLDIKNHPTYADSAKEPARWRHSKIESWVSFH